MGFWSSQRTPSLLPPMVDCCLTPLPRTCPSILPHHSISLPLCYHCHTPHPCCCPQHVMVDAHVTSRHPPLSCWLPAAVLLLSLFGCCWPSQLSCWWLVVASMPALHFLVCCPLSSLQVVSLLSQAITPFYCPLPATVHLISLPVTAHLCCSSINGWLLHLCMLCHPPFVPLSAACSHNLLPLCKH